MNSKILIVEDEKIVSITLQRMLESKGYEVIGNVETGEEAILIAKENKPDIVLMDIMLGGQLDGIETAEVISNELGVPVIYLTAYADDKTTQRAKHTRPYGYLVKPFDHRDLFRTIEMSLYRSEMEEKLKISESRSRAILQTIPDFIIVVKKNGSVIEYNIPTAFEFNEPVEIQKNLELKNLLTNVLATEADVIETFYQEVNETDTRGEVSFFDFITRRKSGFKKNLEARFMKTGKDEVLILIRDTTEETLHDANIIQAIINTEEKERRRFATDLHDGLGQILSAIKMNISAVGSTPDGLPDQHREALDKASELLDKAVKETRNISHNLITATLSQFGLITALKELCSQMKAQPDFLVEFSHYGDESRINENIEVNLYRIAQEVLNNIIKHAEATEVSLQLNRHPNSIILSIEENGNGFNVERSTLNGGIGLKNMKSRVSMLGGAINIESSEGHGSNTSVEIPLS